MASAWSDEDECEDISYNQHLSSNLRLSEYSNGLIRHLETNILINSIIEVSKDALNIDIKLYSGLNSKEAFYLIPTESKTLSLFMP